MQSDPENEEVEAQQRPTSFFAFSVLREETKTVVASLVWESEKPVFGFALFHPGRSRAAGMWKSSRVGEIRQRGFFFPLTSRMPANKLS